MAEPETGQISPPNEYMDYPARTPIEYANKILDAHYGKKYPLLNADLILANLDPKEREIAMSYLLAYAKIMQLKNSVETATKKKVRWQIQDDYELMFCYMIDSSRALGGRTLDAVTMQRIDQMLRSKEDKTPSKGFLRKVTGG